MAMIREGFIIAPGETKDIADESQWDSLGGTLMLTFRAAHVPFDALKVGTVQKVATFQIKLGNNVLSSGGVPIQSGEELPILWQGEIGPGVPAFTITNPSTSAAGNGDVSPVLADMTAT